MPTNKNAAIRYQTLDKCFRDRRHRYYMEDLIDKCEEAIYYYNGVGGVSRRQISLSGVSEDCQATHGWMKSFPTWNGDLDLEASRRT